MQSVGDIIAHLPPGIPASFEPEEFAKLLGYLTEVERKELLRLIGGILWMPQLGAQMEAYTCPADIIGYGGAAGGGKSDLGMGKALTRHRRSVFFRRQLADCIRAINRSIEIIGSRRYYNGNTHTHTLPNGRELEFAGLKDERAKKARQGRDADLMVFDEVAQIPEDFVRYCMGWNRSTDPNQQCQVLMLGNPPLTPEEFWIVDFFAPWLKPDYDYPALFGELRWFAYLDDGQGRMRDVECEGPDAFKWKGEEIKPRSRTFIPASLDDNAFYARTGYRAVLQALPEPMRSALLKGSYDLTAEDHVWQVIPSKHVLMAQERWKSQPRLDRLHHLTALGVDPAHGGLAETVLSRRYNNWFAELECHAGKMTPDGQSVAALVIRALMAPPPEGWQKAHVNIDAVGVGASAYDVLKDYEDFDINAIIGSAKSGVYDESGVLVMRNLRAEVKWAAKWMFDPRSGVNPAIPPDSRLMADLCSTRWRPTVAGITMEEKTEISTRLGGRSPDRGEAVEYASYTGNMTTDAAGLRDFFAGYM